MYIHANAIVMLEQNSKRSFVAGCVRVTKSEKEKKRKLPPSQRLTFSLAPWRTKFNPSSPSRNSDRRLHRYPNSTLHRSSRSSHHAKKKKKLCAMIRIARPEPCLHPLPCNSPWSKEDIHTIHICGMEPLASKHDLGPRHRGILARNKPYCRCHPCI